MIPGESEDVAHKPDEFMPEESPSHRA